MIWMTVQFFKRFLAEFAPLQMEFSNDHGELKPLKMSMFESLDVPESCNSYAQFGFKIIL